MTRHRVLHPGYERLIGAAVVDPDLKRSLLRDPGGTAVQFGISTADAALVADISALDLRSFAAALLPRLYGENSASVPYQGASVG